MTTLREFKIGAFVLLGLALLGFVVFLVGDERQLFASKLVYQAVFDDVQGLKRGSSVRMGGIDIGSVEEVGYGPNPKDSRLYVTLKIVALEARRIRADSRVKIESKGLLGDKMVTISPGSPNSPPISPGEVIPSEQDTHDLQTALSRVGTITSSAQKVMENLEVTTEHLSDEHLNDDLRSSMKSLSQVLASLDGGPGYLSRLINDPAEADRLMRTVDHLQGASVQLERTLTSIAQITDRIEKGPGLLHEVVYGESSAQTAEQVGEAAHEVTLTLKSIREGNGLVRSALFGDDQSQQIVGRLDQILGDVGTIVGNVRAGKGTLGALLVDPSVYEDLKVVLGNVERNHALRALVRYSIEQSDPPRDVQDPDSTPSK